MAEVNKSLSDTTPPEESGRDINVIGVIAVVIFYSAVLVVGIWAGWRQRRRAKMQGKNAQDQETIMVAERNLGLFVGILTMGATWVGGGFLNGSAESAYSYGLIWVQAPFGYGLSLVLNGIFFAKKMRDSRYVTMIDPFTQKYGVWGALQALPSTMSEIFYSASILGALGSTLEVILGIETEIAIVISAMISVLYTLIGGLVSVAYTDVFQIAFMAIGMGLSLPFAMNNENVSSIKFDITDWKGELPAHLLGEWIDFALLILLGGIPWQSYFQRVLSSRTSTRAQVLSFGGWAISVCMAIPAILFGAVAKATNWEATGFGHTPVEKEAKLVLPLCMQYLTPQWVAFFGLGAISAAVMSSTDSSMLSSSSMLARNVYKAVIRPKAKEMEVLICLWACIIVNATISTLLAIKYQSVYNLFILCGDFVYVIVFPQLLLVLYFEKSNTYGSVLSFFVSLILRFLCGDTLLGIPATISFGEIQCHTGPGCTNGPVPFRTMVMLMALILHVSVSWGTDYLFKERIIPLEMDFFQCFSMSSSDRVISQGSRYLYSEEIVLDDVEKSGYCIPRPKTIANAEKC